MFYELNIWSLNNSDIECMDQAIALMVWVTSNLVFGYESGSGKNYALSLHYGKLLKKIHVYILC